MPYLPKSYNAKCPVCGQVDIVFEGQKTHKCSSCGTRNKLDFDDPSCIIGVAENPYAMSVLQVVCPYCGTVELVPFGEKKHRCSACKQYYEVLFEDGTKQNNEQKSSRKSLFDGSRESSIEKKPFRKLLIVSLIIGAIIALITMIPSNSDSSPSKQDSAVMLGVKEYLRETLKDPKSYQEIEWSPSGVNSKGQYYIRHRYRAKNSLGGFVVEEKIFYLNNSYKVVDSHDY